MALCIVCSECEGKYKCPTCLMKYCSVACCRRHKETKCKLIKEEPITEATTDEDDNYQFVTEDTVPSERLKLLEDDKELGNLLNNPHLKNLLKTIDSTKNPDEIMQKAMLEPIFVEFADACLRVVEPEEVTNDN